ncbi:MAG: ribosome small subunit-dependent GTPase A [Anaerolineae bacterium]
MTTYTHARVEHTSRPNQGIVFKKHLGHYFVQSGERTLVCSVSSRLRKRLIYPTSDPSSGTLRRVQAVEKIKRVDPVAVGDVVRFEDAGDGTGMIKEVLPRRNKLVRYAAGPKPLEQVIVANIDQFVPIVAAAQPKPRWGLLDRYLAAAEEAGIPTLICITKLDLAKRQRLWKTVQIYEDIGYPATLTSAVTGEGIAAFRETIQGKISVLVGMSGVGKTTLLNAVQPGLGLRVREISESTGKGKHTTSHVEMFPLDGGGSVVDTPGIKTFGLWETDSSDLAGLFREMQPYVGRCRFRLDCSHTHEPDCAIKDAVEAGNITQLRYKSYLRLNSALRPI